jgi:hypothetical protein
MDQFNDILDNVDNKETTPEHGYTLIRELVETTGFFTADDIKYAYELGRIHQKNKSDCTSEEIKDSWLQADRMNRNIKWE